MPEFRGGPGCQAVLGDGDRAGKKPLQRESVRVDHSAPFQA